MFSKCFLLSTVAALAQLQVAQSSEPCQASCTGVGSQEVCTFKFKINIHAGDTGYYEVEGCDGIQPTLAMKANVQYVFDQSDETNWFHPLGFAYGPDGVYRDQEELEKVSTGGGNFTQFPQYTLNGEKLCDASPCDDEDFGLDQYEGVYFSGGRDDWIDSGIFAVNLTITDAETKEFFYFCHIHNDMSARIKVYDGSVIREAKDLIEIPYEYDQPDAFDQTCGVFNVSQFQADKACPDKTFLCGDDSNNDFGKCMNAIDCAMYEEMRTKLYSDPTVVFMHQMIAHHRNAVNQAKLLLITDPPSLVCGTNYDGRRLDDANCGDVGNDGGEPVKTLLWDIINVQNQQITFMQAWLADNDQPSHGWCSGEESDGLPVGYIAGLAVVGVSFLGGFAASITYFKKSKTPDV